MFRKTDPALERLQRELLAVEEEDFDEETVFNAAARYDGRNPKKFEDDDFFDHGFEEEEVLLKKDYKRKGRKSLLWFLANVVQAAACLAGLAGLLLLVTEWMG